MSFGFAVGDFIAAGKLIIQIGACLNDSRGSLTSYQELRRELLSLQQALDHVNSLTPPSPEQQPAVYAIKCTALSVQYPLTDFLRKVQKYDSSLGKAGGSASKAKDVSMKVRWKMGMEEEVNRIRVILSAHVGTIDMMLMRQGLEAMAIEGNKTDERHKEVCEKFEGSNAVLAGVAERVEAQGRVGTESKEVLGKLEDRVSQEVIPRLMALGEAAEMNRKDRGELRDKLEASQTTIFEASSRLESQGRVGEENRSALERLLVLVSGQVVPPLVSLVDIVGKVLKSNAQIYNLVLGWQTGSQRPDLRFTWAQEPCRLEDALGRFIVVPSEYTYSLVEAIIKDKFRVGPGSQHVMDGDYEVFNSRNSKQLITESDRESLLPGMHITMAVVLRSITFGEKGCPMPHCQSLAVRPALGGGNFCSACKVWFETTTKKRKRDSLVEEVENNKEDEPISKSSPNKQPMLNPSFTQASDGEFESLERFRNVRLDVRGGPWKCPSKSCRYNKVGFASKSEFGDHVILKQWHMAEGTGRSPFFKEVGRLGGPNSPMVIPINPLDIVRFLGWN